METLIQQVQEKTEKRMEEEISKLKCEAVEKDKDYAMLRTQREIEMTAMMQVIRCVQQKLQVATFQRKHPPRHSQGALPRAFVSVALLLVI